MSEADTCHTCPQCKNRFKPKFESKFDNSSGNTHYKNHTCESCGYEISVKVNFIGCGNDTFNSELDKKIRG